VVYSQPSTWDRLTINFPAFYVLPKESALVDAQGLVASPGGCTENGFYGYRYTWPAHGDDVAFIYSESGRIVGIQFLVPTEKATSPLFWKEDELSPGYSQTSVYFSDPETICDPKPPTWDRVTAQYGDEFMDFPLKQSDAVSPWTLGKCFAPLMGVHYWHNMTTSRQQTDPYAPYFLMFNNGYLNAFGFVITSEEPTPTSDLIEHPPPPTIDIFFAPNTTPDWFRTIPYRNTLHVYLQSPGCKNRNYQC